MIAQPNHFIAILLFGFLVFCSACTKREDSSTGGAAGKGTAWMLVDDSEFSASTDPEHPISGKPVNIKAEAGFGDWAENQIVVSRVEIRVFNAGGQIPPWQTLPEVGSDPNAGKIFQTTQVFTPGKWSIQFKVHYAVDEPAQELLDWTISVK